MKPLRNYWQTSGSQFMAYAAGLAITVWLFYYKLGRLTGGLSKGELSVATTPIGWHGLYHNPLYLPLQVLRSIVFFIFPQHGQLLTRLPNVIFGLLTIVAVGLLIKQWHGNRTALFGTILFATCAWLLHVSRLASPDVLYLWVLPALLLIDNQLHQRYRRPVVFYGSIMLWGSMLYIPGMVWVVALAIYWQRRAIAAGWRYFATWWQRLAYLLAGLAWLPLLVHALLKGATLKAWLGLPSHAPTAGHYLKELLLVPWHLFVRGPHQPELWLGHAPILDVFALVACGAGIYFYASHWQARRSRQLASFLVLGALLVALAGPVTLSLLVPLLYLAAATGLAYLLHEWLQVFPLNPLARSLGIGLIAIAVALSALYNVRAYFTAWPHNADTQAIFIYHR